MSKYLHIYKILESLRPLLEEDEKVEEDLLLFMSSIWYKLNDEEIAILDKRE